MKKIFAVAALAIALAGCDGQFDAAYQAFPKRQMCQRNTVVYSVKTDAGYIDYSFRCEADR